ncbi:FecCD family ABC transporter permease [Desulfoplanes formicivorans]|uniref:ABC transporter permease n=1 Tax=Desulfoplanes formicivorans TaxID=1592317 RepID=A0A194AF40_9BACT|nr:iron ABC transporter permease [Desulfoplanes formicivorans]GAU07399.1 ABC transporter permease [Desulfoplanes formicivorans]
MATESSRNHLVQRLTTRFRKPRVFDPHKTTLGDTGYRTLQYATLGGLMLLTIISLHTGRLDISSSEIRTIVWAALTGTPVDNALLSKSLVFFQVRLPRCILAILVGMGLSASGAVYQALFRNPLVSPDILGVAAGCTFGAALALILPGSSFALVRVLAFIFGLTAVFSALGIARAVGVKPILILVLAGLVVTSFFNAFVMILKYMADPYNQLPAIVFWTMGSFSRAAWKDVNTLIPLVGLGLILITLLRYRLNVLSLGDVQAKSLGLNPKAYRILLIVISSLIVALAVATCGQVCWVGLVIPHIARTLVGPNHKKMLPVTITLGGLFMLLADDIARSVTTAELPISIVTSLIGAPLFAFLLYKNRGSGWI